MDELSGKQLGQYQIVSPLGQGGMATVYRAYQPGMDRYVALKVLPSHYAADPNFINRFRQEAKVIARLEHPNILPVYDYGESDGFTYLVMRLVEGGTLAESMHGWPLPLQRIREVITQVGDALDYAHSRGVVHRDVKPSNVLVDKSGHCLLTDFGIAKMVEGTAQFTMTGSFVGTPHYASPEQALGRELDARSDLYSLGVVLYEMATGRQPFDAETPLAVALKHVHDPLPAPRRLNPSMPEAVERVIHKALAKDRDERYATASDMTQGLRAAVLEPRPEGASPPTVLETPETVLETDAAGVDARPATGGVAAARQTPTPPPPATPPPRAPRRRWIPSWVWVSGGLSALFLLCVAAALAGGLGTPFLSRLLFAGDSPSLPITGLGTAVVQPAAQVPPLGSNAIYVEYVLDASGSMLETLQGKTKLAIAREVLSARVAALPPDVNVGLRAYGHRVPFDQREASCQDIELVVPVQAGGSARITEWLATMQAQGMTPMSESIRQAAEDFTFEPGRNNSIVLISDGIETCGDDPANVAKYLQELGIDFTIHVIGLGVDQATREQLTRLAQVGGGIYHDANSEQDLQAALLDIESAVLVPPAAVAAAPTEAAPAAPTEAAAVVPTEAAPVAPTQAETVAATEAPTAVPTDTPVPEPNVDSAREGTVEASSVYPGYSAAMATDGDVTTSWFSAGSSVEGPTSTFRWTGARDDFIGSIAVLSNAEHSVPEFRTGFGFGSVNVQVLDASGAVVFTQDFLLDGTPDPNVYVRPNVVGRSITLAFSGHESPDCGGFSELQVGVVR